MKKLLVSLFVLIFFNCKDLNESSTLPNILWLVAEDQSPEFFSMYGNDMISLPNLEKLTRDGTIYTNAYAPVPVCAPSRSALITGMYPSSIGTHNMRTYNAFKEVNEPSLNIPSYSPILPEGVKMFTEYLRKVGYYCTNNSKEDYNFKTLPSAWDESGKKAHWKNRPKGTPFFSIFNFGITHESQIWKQSEKPLLVDPSKLIVPPIFPDNHIIRRDLAINFSNLIRLDKQVGNILNELKNSGLYDNTLIFFYSDHGGPFPRHKRALYETGIKVPLIIKMPKKTDVKKHEDRFVSFIDYAPTLLSFIGIKPPEIMQGNAFLGKYKSDDPSFVFTTSDRYDEKIDKLRAIRYSKYKYIRNFNPYISNAIEVSYREQMPMMQNMREKWKSNNLPKNISRWFETPKPKEELYDITIDPYELNNLAKNPSLKDTLFFLRNKLDQWIEETGDLGVFTEKEILKSFFPNGKPPKLSSLSYEIEDGLIILTHPNKGSSIIWQKADDKSRSWNIYDKPLSSELQIVAKAVRIGYDSSEVLKINWPKTDNP